MDCLFYLTLAISHFLCDSVANYGSLLTRKDIWYFFAQAFDVIGC